MGQTVLVLHTALPPVAVAEALRASIDENRWTPFSMSGYRGERPVLGEVHVDSFRLQKRKYYRNDFAGQFFAQFAPEAGGTRIEGYFDAPRWARYFMRVWLAFAVLVGGPIFLLSTLDQFTATSHTSGDNRVGFIVPLALIVFGVALPKLGRLVGRSNEQFILEFVKRVVSAHEEACEKDE